MLTLQVAEVGLAVGLLRQGGIGAFPTDTVYGLGGSASLEPALERVFQAKGRPHFQPLPLLIADLSQLDMVVAHVPHGARLLMERFFPGALTLVLPAREGLSPLITGGGKGVGVRLPNHPVPQALARGLGGPIVGTSANRSGHPAPLTADQVVRELDGMIDFLVDGGRCPGGVESTVVDLTAEAPRLLRQGAIPRRAIEEVMGCALR